MLHTCVTCSDSLKPIALFRCKSSSMFVSGCVCKEILRLIKGPLSTCISLCPSQVSFLPVWWLPLLFSPSCGMFQSTARMRLGCTFKVKSKSCLQVEKQAALSTLLAVFFPLPNNVLLLKELNV